MVIVSALNHMDYEDLEVHSGKKIGNKYAYIVFQLIFHLSRRKLLSLQRLG